jgi:hypothetical protein
MWQVYTDVAVLAAKRAAKSWLAALSIPIYAFLVLLVGAVVAPLGIIGALVIGVLSAACFGAYLMLLSQALDGNTIRWADLKNGLRAVWDVCGVFFVLSLFGFVLAQLQRAAGANGTALGGVVAVAGLVFLNALPEAIYLRGTTFVAAIRESASFVMEHPFAWLGPNLVFAAVILWATGSLTFDSPRELIGRVTMLSPYGVLGLIGGTPIWTKALLIVFVHYVMVFRGLLFRELSSGSTRMRAFRRRMNG